MTRPRFLLACTLALAACGRAPVAKAEVLTERVGAWHRTSLREVEVAPDPVPAGAIERIRSATYEGPGKIEVRVYQLSSAAVALDVVQRWKAAPDTVLFYSDRFFAVVQWQGAERSALREFVGILEKGLAGKK